MKTINIRSLDGFSSPVTLVVQSLPEGLSADLQTSQLVPAPNGQVSTFMYLRASARGPFGSFNLRVLIISGQLVRAYSFPVSIVEALDQYSFSAEFDGTSPVWKAI